jgi:uncharacterized protein YjbI with pentapeptide repeats
VKIRQIAYQERAMSLRTYLIILVVTGVIVIGIIAIIHASSFPDKTAWDLFEILLIPLALLFASVWFSQQQKAWEMENAAEQRKLEQQTADSRIEETRLQDYFDRMTDLLLREKLRDTEEETEVRSIAQARTLNILSSLNGKRKGEVLRFLIVTRLVVSDKSLEVITEILRNAHLVERPDKLLGEPIISLCNADLAGVELPVPYLFLLGAKLQYANLQRADLTGLIGGIPVAADLRGANLERANLQEAKLAGADLQYADLQYAHLQGANLQGANLQNADLLGADLRGANLERATLRKTDLRAAKLKGANLNHILYVKMDGYWPDGYTPPPTAINTSRPVGGSEENE